MVIEADTPTTTTDDPIVMALRAAIIAEQTRLGMSERQLAKHYGVGRMTIWRFKAGKLSNADRVLATILLHSPADRSVT